MKTYRADFFLPKIEKTALTVKIMNKKNYLSIYETNNFGNMLCLSKGLSVAGIQVQEPIVVGVFLARRAKRV